MTEPGSIEDAVEILRANYRGHAKAVRIGRGNDDQEWIEIHLPALSQARPPAQYLGYPVRVLNAETKAPFAPVELSHLAAPLDPARAQAEQRARMAAQPAPPPPSEVPAVLSGKPQVEGTAAAPTTENAPPIAPSKKEYIEAGYPADNYDAFLQNLLNEGFAPPRNT